MSLVILNGLTFPGLETRTGKERCKLTFSFHYARRQYNLANDENLRYHHLLNWDRALMLLDREHHCLSSPPAYISLKHELDKVIVFERGHGLLWLVNLHPWQSLVDYRVGVDTPGTYRILLNSDDPHWFGGHGRVDEGATCLLTQPIEYCGRRHSLQVYLPCRTALVLLRVEDDSLPHAKHLQLLK